MFRRFAPLVFFLIVPFTAHAASIGFATSSGVTFSSDPVFASLAVKVFTVIVNNQYQSLAATVAFYDNGNEIGRSNAVVPLEEARQVQTQWTPDAGSHIVSAKFVAATGTDLQGNTHQLSTDEINAVASPVSRTLIVDNDSDRDGIGDHDEISTYHTSPTQADTDGDGLSDYQEIFKYKTDPNNPNTDGDNMNDGDEVRAGRNPLVKDDPAPPPPPTPVVTPAPTPKPPQPEPQQEKPAPKQSTKIESAPTKSVVPTPLTKKSEPASSNTDSVQTPSSTPIVTTSTPSIAPTTIPTPPSIGPTEDTNWVKVLGIVAALLAIATAVSGALAYRERRKYHR